MVGLDLIGCRSMTAGEMERMDVMPQEQRLVVGERVVVAEQAPHLFLEILAATVELRGFHLGELAYQRLVNDEVLPTALAWRLVSVFADALSQKPCHLEMRIAKQGGNAELWRKLLGVERSATVAHQQIGVLLLVKFLYIRQRYFRTHGQVGRNDFPRNASLNATAGTHSPEAKKPCRNITFFIIAYCICLTLTSMLSYDLKCSVMGVRSVSP